MKRYIDMDKYPRIRHFNYFREMAHPYVGLTSNVDITDFVGEVKEKGYPFFLSFLYYVSNAANQVQELRQRIEGEKITEYDRCRTSHTVALPDGTYCFCQLDSDMDFDVFLSYAKEEQEKAKKVARLDDGEDPASLFFISTLPWLTYTNIIQPTPSPADSNVRITWGKYFKQEGRILMPVTVLCNHALVDGRHIAEFFSKLTAGLER